MSAWTNSKQEDEEETNEAKGNLFCLARGQTEQPKLFINIACNDIWYKWLQQD